MLSAAKQVSNARKRLVYFRSMRQLSAIRKVSKGTLSMAWLSEFASGKIQEPGIYQLEALVMAMEKMR